MSRTIYFGIFLLLGMLALAARAPAADEPKDEPKVEEGATAVVLPEDVKDHVGKTATVEYTVQAARELTDKSICFLNSEKDHRRDSTFTAFITPLAFKKFKEADIKQPAVHFLNKKIRVTGKVKLFKDRAEIEVASPDQIKIVEEEMEAKEAA